MNEHIIDPKVLAAIISSVISLIIAIISLAYNRKSQKEIINQNEKIEKLKSELALKLEKEKVHVELYSQEIKGNLKSLQYAIRDIQKIKENLSLIIKTPLKYIDLEDVIQTFSKVNKELQENYQSSKGQLGIREDGILHNVKNMTQHINNLLIQTKNQYNENGHIDEKFYKRLKKCREEYSDIQNSLRDIRIEKIEQKIQ